MAKRRKNPDGTRPLTGAERRLAEWMLEHGTAEARDFLEQLELAVVSGGCPCGCASINFKIEGKSPAPPGVHILADFLFGTENDPKGIFIYQSHGILSGVEVFGYGGAHPKELPEPEALRPALARRL